MIYLHTHKPRISLSTFSETVSLYYVLQYPCFPDRTSHNTVPGLFRRSVSEGRGFRKVLPVLVSQRFPVHSPSDFYRRLKVRSLELYVREFTSCPDFSLLFFSWSLQNTSFGEYCRRTFLHAIPHGYRVPTYFFELPVFSVSFLGPFSY